MARMIPEHLIKPERTPLSEWELIVALQNDKGSSGTWTVLQSLDIRRHITKLEGEADLLVLAPGLGVMVVEVKGCNVSRTAGVWKYHYTPPEASHEGPFEQSRTAMHSIKKWLKKKGEIWLRENGLERWEKWAWHSCVVFTSIERIGWTPANTPAGPEWTPAEVVTRSDITSYGAAEALARALKARRTELAQKKLEDSRSAGWFDEEKSRPTPAEMEALLCALRPDFHYEGEALANIERLEQVIRDTTEEQAAIASSLLDNRRLVLKGAAGTGKTYVAVRMARYLADSGFRVGFLCFNNLLGAWLKSELTDLSARNGYVGTFSRLLLDIAGEKVPPGAGKEFWEGLPERAQNRLVENDAGARFDVLIVDEAQDLLREEMIDVLDLLVEGGLKDGRWIFAGDFSGQAIFSSGASEEQLLARLERKGIAQATYALNVNCRNALRVTENIGFLTTPQVTYRSCLQAEFPGEFRPHFVRGTESAMQGKLKELLTDLRKKFPPEQIVVLSPRSTSTAAALASAESGVKLHELDGPMPKNGFSGYSTIHSFKGLDAQAIILTDVVDLDDALFYTGISRGRQEVHVLLNEGMKQSYANRIVR